MPNLVIEPAINISVYQGQTLVPDERQFLPMSTDVEILRPDLPRGRFRSVLFDFDGTLSLIREGWPQVMIPMMVEVLRRPARRETRGELTAARRRFRDAAQRPADDLPDDPAGRGGAQRGGQPLEPLAYKHRYHDLLMARIRGPARGPGDGRGHAGGLDRARQPRPAGGAAAARR